MSASRLFPVHLLVPHDLQLRLYIPFIVLLRLASGIYTLARPLPILQVPPLPSPALFDLGLLMRCDHSQPAGLRAEFIEGCKELRWFGEEVQGERADDEVVYSFRSCLEDGALRYAALSQV